MQNTNVPKGWNIKSMGDCFRFLRTKSFSRAETECSGDVKYVHYGDIHTKYPLIISPKEIDLFISTEQAINADLLRSGDLILLDASEDYEGTTKCIELSNVSPEDKIVSGLHTIALRDDHGVFANRFRAYITSMPYVKKNFWKQISGVKVYGISKDNLKKIKVLVPPIAEQKKIAEILGTWDREIEELTELITEKKELRKGLANRLLNGLMWQDVELSDLLNYEQPTKYLVTEILDYDAQKTPVLTANKAFILGSTDDTTGVYSKQDCIIFDDFTTDMKYVDFKFKVKSSAIKILTPKGNVNLKFVFEQMQRLKLPIGGHKRYWLSEYQYLTIKMPNEDTQSKIVSILSRADAEIDLLNQQLDVLKEQKRGLMQKLLTGEIRIKVDKDEQ